MYIDDVFPDLYSITTGYKLWDMVMSYISYYKWRWKKYIYIHAPSNRELAEFVRYSNTVYNRYGYFFRIIPKRKPPFFVEIVFFHRDKKKGPVRLITFEKTRDLPRDRYSWGRIIWKYVKQYISIHGFYGSLG